MKKTYLLLSLLITMQSVLAQRSKNIHPDLAAIAKPGDASGWLKFNEDVKINAASLFLNYQAAFGLSSNDQMQLQRVVKDKHGFVHYRYAQHYRQVKVEGAEYMLHEKNGHLTSANGKIVAGLNMSVNPSITSEQSIEKALAFINAEQYMWDDPGAEATLKRIKKDPFATFYPRADLVLVDKNFGVNAKDYRLAYKMIIMTEKPVSRMLVYVDAHTGDIYHSLNLLHTANNTNGTAVTKYSGTQTIVTDSVAPATYRLVETTRGNGIETYNMATGTVYGNAVDFTDTDNYWNNVNPQQDEAATDAHFAAEMTYDYFMSKYGYSSFDGNGSALISYVHYDVNYVNAFWNGSWMTYGDGNGNVYTPLTSLDVGGHEIAHGVTESTANLVYQNESGALNESFSDIFGTAVEMFADPANFDWKVGEDFSSNGLGFRSMSNPNSMQDPDTYGGTYWYTGTNDNGGVHTNSGVQNFWFYLLTQGGVGTNDHGNAYNVSGLGIDTAAAIAFRVLHVYLTQTSTYADAREASVLAAEDLYGPCSNAVLQTANAWHAVGVGNPIADYDMKAITVSSPVTSCGLGASESITVQLRYNGCNFSFNAGDSIPVAYMVDNNPAVMDTIVLSAPVTGGDTITFTFGAPADFSAIGNHTVAVWPHLGTDPVSYNDTAIVIIENKIQQNIDVGVVEIISPASACQLSSAETVQVRLRFFGCDSLAAGDSITVAYQLDNILIERDTIVLPAAVYSGQAFLHTFNTPVNLSSFGSHTISSWTEFNADTLNGNDSIVGIQVKNPWSVEDQIVTFEAPVAVLDSMRIITNPESNAYVSSAAARTGTKGFLMTGGDPINYNGEIVLPDGMNNWLVNEDFSAKVCFCVDATGWQTANLRFDLKQTFSSVYMLYAGSDFPDASSFRVLVNNNQVGGTYNPATYTNDPYLTHFVNLDQYAGSPFEVCFETRNGFNDAADPIGTGDNAYIDNVYFSEVSTIGVNEQHVSEFIQVYPNPNDGMFNIAYNAVNRERVAVEIVDVTGRVVRAMTSEVQQGVNFFAVDLGPVAKGIYVVQLRSTKQVLTQRVIVN